MKGVPFHTAWTTHMTAEQARALGQFVPGTGRVEISREMHEPDDQTRIAVTAEGVTTVILPDGTKQEKLPEPDPPEVA